LIAALQDVGICFVGREVAGQFKRLVEATLAQSGRSQGHGDHHVSLI
jgi:hypothetical protein